MIGIHNYSNRMINNSWGILHFSISWIIWMANIPLQVNLHLSLHRTNLTLILWIIWVQEMVCRRITSIRQKIKKTLEVLFRISLLLAWQLRIILELLKAVHLAFLNLTPTLPQQSLPPKYTKIVFTRQVRAALMDYSSTHQLFVNYLTPIKGKSKRTKRLWTFILSLITMWWKLITRELWNRVKLRHKTMRSWCECNKISYRTNF